MEYEPKHGRRRGELISIDQILDRSSRNGFFHFLANRSKLTEIWKSVVGPKVAANAMINSFELSRLEVYVRGPAYLERYRYFLKEWIKRINIEYGDEIVTEIVLKIGQPKPDPAD
ncbi:MAG: DUF721 domain-containing protein [Deltaproteobacteria bacterium]|jgi:hypothetical protein|nr:DUF721 domain-containing protein [Deltaproteobacteria bacterium]